MPAKKTLQTIFENEKDFHSFILATIADCSAISAEMAKYGEQATQEIIDEALGIAYTRVRLIMGEYGRRLLNGDADDILSELTEQDIKDYREGCVKFSKRVMGREGDNAEESSEPEVSDKADSDNAKKD